MTHFMSPALYPRNWSRALKAQVPRKTARDVWNRLRYGAAAPLSDECIHIDPRAIRLRYLRAKGGPALTRQKSGMVLGGDWDLCRGSAENETKYISCHLHFIDGQEWAETPIYQRLLREIEEGHVPDDCPTPAALKGRYAALDRFWAQIKSTGGLRPKTELPDYFRREHGGIYVHIARDGALLRSSGGAHRLALAQLAGLDRIPAQLGVIHPIALKDGWLDYYRKRPD